MMMSFFRIAMMLTACLILLGSCGKDEAASGGANEFTVDGKTYQIGETIWMEQIGMITHSEDAKEHFSLTLPDQVEVGSFKVGTTNSTTMVLGGTPGTGTYWAKNNKVTVTIKRIGTTSTYGARKIEGTFSGTFSTSSSLKGEEVEIKGKFSTKQL